jgi:hypothetical protein
MPGIEVTLTNIFQFGAFISPFLLGFFLILSSIFNQDLKGFVYLAGVLLSSVINILLKNIIRSPMASDAEPICSLVKMEIFSDQNFNSPNISSSFLAFTIAYLLLPMFYNNQMNYIVLVFLIVLFVLDTMTKLANKCTDIMGVSVGALVGFIMGAIWFSMFLSGGQGKLLYFNQEVSNNVVCSKPSNQTFKCSVYKGGQLISDSIV